LSFVGIIEQIPPIYSAIKLNGKALYKYALAKEEVTIKPRKIEIKNITIINISQDVIKIKINCSKGTYIRTLAHDIGIALKVGAHLIELQRTLTNCLELNHNLTLENIINMTTAERLECLLPIDTMLQSIPIIYINQEQLSKIKHGNHITLANNLLPQQDYRIYHNKEFLGIGRLLADQILQPKRLISNIK
jgi:tRNA pseudouridine55 synthase